MLNVLNIPMDEIMAKFKMQQYVSELGLTLRSDEIIDFKQVINAFNPQRAKNNPIPITEELKVELYEYLNNMKKIVID
jgi:hypothetical protein